MEELELYNNVKNKLKTFLNLTDLQIDEINGVYKDPQFPTELTIPNINKYYLDYNNSPATIVNRERVEIWDEQITKMNLVLKQIQRLGLKEPVSVLDYGCGIGIFTYFLSQYKGFHIDAVEFPGLTLDWVQYKCDSPNVKTTSLFDYEWNKKYDIVMCTHVIEHVPDPEQLLNECMNATKGGGLLWIDYPDTWREPEKNPEHLGKDEFKNKIGKILADNGFAMLLGNIKLWKRIDHKSDLYGDSITIKVREGGVSVDTTFPRLRMYEAVGVLEYAKQLLLNTLTQKSKGSQSLTDKVE